jgi:glyoxylase-like metal-dependent hydrolase (beta-lactamase superfamily II)
MPQTTPRKSVFALTLLFGVLAFIAISWAKDAAPDARSAIANATQALGAGSLKTIEFSGSGFDYTIGQNYNGASPWPKFNDKTYTRVIDFDAPASRMSRIRTQAENPPHGGGQQPVIGDQQQNQVAAAGSPQAAGLKDDLMMSVPYGFLRAAAAAGDATVKSQKMTGKPYTVISFTGGNKAAVHGYLDAQNMLEKVETKIDNNVLGDIDFTTTFSDYKDFAGVKFPTHIVQSQGGYPVLDLTIAEVKPNAPANIAAPPGRGGGPGGGAPAAVNTEKLGDGVYLILGGYAALAVDMGNHITVVECPQSDDRANAVIAKAKELIPGKPITECVNTHTHFDHSGGVRAFIAEGATIITQEANKAYYEKIFKNPHTIAPDRLAQNPKKPVFKTVKDHMTITDGTHTIELYHQTNFGHHDGMLLVYLPKEKVLLEADGYNPAPRPPTETPATLSPYNQNLADNIARLNLDVQRIIPVHYPADNRKITMSELMLAIGKKS